MKKYLILPAVAALMMSPALAQDANTPKSTTQGEDAATSQPAPPPSAGTGMSAPSGDVNQTKATTQGEDANTTGAPPQASGGVTTSAPGEVKTETQGGIADPSARDAANPVAGKGAN